MKKKVLRFGNRTKYLVTMIFHQFQDPFYQGVAAQIAFSLFLSIIPILILLSQLLGVFSLSLSEIQQWVGDNVTVENAAPLIEMLEYSPSGVNSLFMAVIAVWAASRVQFSLMRVANYTITDGKSIGRGFIRDKIKSIQDITMMILTLAFALVVLVYGELIMTIIYGPVIGEEISSAMWVLLRWPLAIFMYFLMISYNYYMLPSEKVPFRDVIPGSIFAAVGFWIVTYLYTFYTGISANYDILYGSFSNIVALMFWFYFLAWVMCIGVSFNRVWWATREKNNIPIPDHRRKNINKF